MAAGFPRPATPSGFDPSRAAVRAAEPDGWRSAEAVREAVYEVIHGRRDIRRFRPDAVGEDVLERVLEAAHRAPSVGLMQPWRFIVVASEPTRIAVRALAQRERIRQSDRFDAASGSPHARAAHFLDQKVEGIVEAPLGVCVCCDPGDPATEVLGRGTIPQTDVYSTACAIQNLWLAARAEGLGVGWVSFYRPGDLRALLGLPERVDPIAWLCLGWPDERPVRPGLEASGWGARVPLSAVVMHERWSGSPNPGTPAGFTPDRVGAVAARDRSDTLVKPAGSLGALEAAVERWAQITGEPPPAPLRAGVLVCAADHGHLVDRARDADGAASLFDARVSAQVAAAAARGETAVAVLARSRGDELVIADLGLVADTPPGVRDHKLGRGSADLTVGPALSEAQLAACLDVGRRLTGELAARGVDCLVLGEIGMGNTASAAALACALTGAEPEMVVGRGTGVDAAGLDRKRALAAAGLARAGSAARESGRGALRELGGLELATIAGAITGAAEHRLPVVLDGFAVSVAALAAVRDDRSLGETLLAGHRSAELGHRLVLAELGLEALLDLRLRLGEASGALLALGLLEAAGRLHREMGTFAEAGVDGPG